MNAAPTTVRQHHPAQRAPLRRAAFRRLARHYRTQVQVARRDPRRFGIGMVRTDAPVVAEAPMFNSEMKFALQAFAGAFLFLSVYLA